MNRPGARPDYSLTIVIPALNEEGAIASIIERCLAAGTRLKEEAGLANVDIVVVSDGSSDRTPEIAQGYPDIQVIVFPVNRGYGAAIQAGWRAKPNELLAFIDADGTCDPLFFIPMCRLAIEQGFSIVLGSRLGADSEMPKIRRLGNRCYALLLRMLSRREVQDAASGMRVVRKDALGRLLPLPDGLHFTPAMSARALLDDVSIRELPMQYRERIGRSKLNVLKDGLRFLSIILNTALYVRPSRLLLPIVGVLLGLSALLLAQPTVEYVQFRHVEDWMIYRFLFSGLCITLASLLGGATYIIEQVIAVSRTEYLLRMQQRDRWWTVLDTRWIGAGGALLLVLGIGLAWPAIVSFATTGTVTVHWSRIVTAMFSVILAAQAGVTLTLAGIVRGVVKQQAAWLQAKEFDPVELEAAGARG